jgi:hypothetical protein
MDSASWKLAKVAAELGDEARFLIELERDPFTFIPSFGPKNYKAYWQNKV